MTAQRVLILASDAKNLESMVRVPSLKGVHFSILSEWKSGAEALRKENFSVIVARKFSNEQGTDAFVADLLALAPKTSIIFILAEKEGPSVLEALKGGVSEILFQESLAGTLVPCVEKYLFSGYGLLRRMSLDELFDFCIPVITSTDMGLLATTILEKFREALGASFGILFRCGEKGGGPHAIVASLGFADDIVPAGFLRRFGNALTAPGPGPTVIHAATLNASAAGGADVDDATQLAIALQACLLTLNLPEDSYRGWNEIILYPDEFLRDREEMDEAGVVHRSRDILAGESWHGGPLVLSIADVAASGQADGFNVVLHEFAHKLDMKSGDANGLPPMHEGMSRQRWSGVMNWAFDDFQRRVDRGEDTPLDPYGAELPTEFFAVASEAFFETPGLLRSEYPDVFAQLKLFYRQDPSAAAE